MLFVSVLSRFSSKRARLCSRRRFCREGIHKEKRKRRRLPASPASPLRKRSRLLRRFGCKRPHDASAALPIACGARQEDSPCGESAIRARLCSRRRFCREGIHKEKRKRRRLPASPASPLRKRSRLLRRFGCKRPHDASAALPIACGKREAARKRKKRTALFAPSVRFVSVYSIVMLCVAGSFF